MGNIFLILVGIVVLVLLIGLVAYLAFLLKRLFIVEKQTRKVLFLFVILSILVIASALWVRGLYAVAVLYTVCIAFFIDLLRLVIRFFKRIAYKVTNTSFTSSPPHKLIRFLVFPICFSLAITWYGYTNINKVVATEYTVHSSKVSQAYNILFISDIHYGSVQKKDVLTRKVEEMKKHKIDMVILGGDIVDENTSKEDMHEAFSHLASISSTYGTFYVHGNHDRGMMQMSTDFTEKELEQTIKDNGIRILNDAYEKCGDVLLVGREDRSRMEKRTSAEELFSDIDENKNFILVADHQPSDADEVAHQKADMQLSGHTHAMQVAPAGFIARLLGAYVYGEYHIDDMQLYVSSGFAGWGFPVRTEKNSEYVLMHIEP
ncbi:MAG: metallophosphoesterase [Actinomycetaceae bacterium]|nr:metallophosphoesterase [Actinomycetaceae bacterium]